LRNAEVSAITERAKLYIYASARPIRRLERDVGDIRRFEGAGVFSAQVRLVIASPPLLPASADILNAAVSVCGERLFDDPYRLLLDSMALLGPVAAAEAFVLLAGDSSMTDEVQAVGDAFEAVFDRYPETFLSSTRAFLVKHWPARR
jgi:hypothetical protein